MIQPTGVVDRREPVLMQRPGNPTRDGSRRWGREERLYCRSLLGQLCLVFVDDKRLFTVEHNLFANHDFLYIGF